MGGAPDMNQTPTPLQQSGTDITYPLLKFVQEQKKPAPFEESTWAERQRKKGYKGSRMTLTRPKQQKGSGVNTPSSGGSGLPSSGQ